MTIPETKPQRCPTCAAPAEPVDDMVKNDFGDYVPMWRYDARTALREALRERIEQLTDGELDGLIGLGYDQFEAAPDAAGYAYARAAMRSALLDALSSPPSPREG